MDNYDKFDNYIKGLFDKDLEVPSELNWEEMDFDLPQLTGEQSNQGGGQSSDLTSSLPLPSLSTSSSLLSLSSLLFVMTIIISTFAVIYINSNIKKNDNQKHTQQTLESTDNEAISNVPPLTTLKDTQKDTNYSETTPSDKGTTPHSIVHNKKTTEQTTGQPNNQTTKQPISQTTGQPDNQTRFIPEKSQSNIVAPNVGVSSSSPNTQNNDLIPPTNAQNTPLDAWSDDNISQIPPSTTKPGTDIGTSTNEPTSISEQVPLPDTPVQLSNEGIATGRFNKLPLYDKTDLTLIPELSEIKYADKRLRLGTPEILVGYGLNYFNLNGGEASSPLKDKIRTDTISMSLKTGLAFHLNHNWRTDIQLRYDRYHSTFEHLEGPIDSFYETTGSELLQVYEYKRTLHNNFTNTLGLQLGVQRKWQVARRLQLYAGLNITPTYILSVSGKTLVAGEIETFTLDSQIPRFLINAGGSAGVIIPLNNAINIEAAYQYDRFFLNNIIINNDLWTNQKNALSFTLSYKLLNTGMRRR